MEVIKLQCASCGSPLEVKPDMERATCPYCGMTYLIGRNGDNTSGGRTKSANGDNPVDVLLIPLFANTVVNDTRLQTSAALNNERFPYTGSFANSILSDSHIEALDALDNKVQKAVRFISCIAYVTKKTYTLDIGDVKMDPVFLYYNAEKESKDEHFAPEEMSCFTEPEAIYTGRDSLAKPKGGYPVYEKKLNDKKNREYKERLSALIAKYQMDCKDTVRYSEVIERFYTRKTFFGGTEEKKRYWTERYTSRSLFVNVDPARARQFLTDEDISRLDRMESIACIPEMAAVIFKEFSKDARQQLEMRVHANITLEIVADKTVVKNLRNLRTHRQGSRTWQSPEWIEIVYHNYGMSTINDTAVLQYLAAYLIRHVDRMLQENGDPAWKLTSFFGEKTLTLSFYPTLKAVGVYNEWV